MCAIVTIMIAQYTFSVAVDMRTLLDRNNFSSKTNGQVAARRVAGLILKRLWSYLERERADADPAAAPAERRVDEGEDGVEGDEADEDVGDQLHRLHHSVVRRLVYGLIGPATATQRAPRFHETQDRAIIIIAEMAVFNMAGYLIEERRRWPVITASTRGQYSEFRKEGKFRWENRTSCLVGLKTHPTIVPRSGI